MEKALLFIFWLSLVFVPYRVAMAVEVSSFESQLLEAHKIILSQADLTHEGFTLQAVISPVSEKEPTLFMEMFVSWSRPEQLYIIERNLKINIIGNRNWNNGVIIFTGDLEAIAEPLIPMDFSSGYQLKGETTDVRIARAGPGKGYFIHGTHKGPDWIERIPLAIHLAPTEGGWDVTSNNMSLHIYAGDYVASIEGRIENNIGKFELGVLGSCLGAVRSSPQSRVRLK